MFIITYSMGQVNVPFSTEWAFLFDFIYYTSAMILLYQPTTFTSQFEVCAHYQPLASSTRLILVIIMHVEIVELLA